MLLGDTLIFPNELIHFVGISIATLLFYTWNYKVSNFGKLLILTGRVGDMQDIS